jgi:flagellar basal body-associated protein FliL
MMTATTDTDSRTAWWVALLALGSLLAGFLAVSYFAQNKAADTLPRYVQLNKLDVQSSGGLVVLSLDLEMAPSDLARVEQFKGPIEARLREALTPLDPARMYSRPGKEALAAGLRDVANHVLGEDLISGVYFGDFRIYSQAP